MRKNITKSTAIQGGEGKTKKQWMRRWREGIMRRGGQGGGIEGKKCVNP
jgi:hypothetical protein